MTPEKGQEESLDGLAADLATSPYEPVRFLARGGMGEVVVVQHRELGRKLVMKLLRTNLEGQEHLAERMRAEARMLARLSHPSLVAVVDSGRTAGGRPFLVTELLEGETLSEYVAARGGHLPVREALELGIQALDGLSVVHEAGFVHRDLKPANLFMVKAAGSEMRRLKILDFGIAKALSDTDRKALGLIAPTTEGAIMGTPSSVSPEQVQSGKVDARTDVYGLGVVLFRLIAGRPPFLGDALALFRAHLLEPAPAASSIAKQPVPAVVDKILMTSLQKEPAKRFQSAAEMRAALERALLDLSLDHGLDADPTDVSEGDGNARTVEAPYARTESARTVATTRDVSPNAARDTSDDETTTRPVGGTAALVTGAALPGGTAALPASGTALPTSGTAALPSVGARGTAMLDRMAAAGLGPTPSPSPAPAAVSPSPTGASVRVPPAGSGFAPKPDPVEPGPSAAGATPPRMTELIARVARSAPRDTMKLEDAPDQGPPGQDSLWKYDPVVTMPRQRAMHITPVPRRSALATWGPIAFALVASIVVLLCLFVWRVL